MLGTRRLLASALLTGTALLATGLPGTPTAVAATGAAPGTAVGPLTAPAPQDPAGPLLFGTAGGVVPGRSTTRLDAFEKQIGRRVATVRVYAAWNSTWPDTLSTASRDKGEQVVLSVKARTTAGAPVRYASIAAAAPGDPVYAQLQTWAQQLKAFHAPVFFSFNHEPEVSKSDQFGTAAEYAAAFRRIVTVFRDAGVTDAEYVFIGTAFGFSRLDKRNVFPYYPGDDYVDDIAVDGYNWYTCRPGKLIAWTSAKDLIEPFRQFGLKHPTKGLMVTELSSAEDPAVPGRKGQWYRDAAALFAQPGYGQFRAVAEWQTGGTPSACQLRVDSTATALAGFQAWGADPRYAPFALVPSAPRQVAAVPGALPGSVDVSWAPAGTGGSAVTAYTVTVAQTGEQFTVAGDSTTFRYQPLLPAFPAYSFSVQAGNAVGTGRTSLPTGDVGLSPVLP